VLIPAVLGTAAVNSALFHPGQAALITARGGTICDIFANDYSPVIARFQLFRAD
jgi:hypothetical protein